MLSISRLSRGDKPADSEGDAEKQRRASMEEPEVEIFINPIVVKRHETNGRWDKLRKEVFMPRRVISSLKSTQSEVKSGPALKRTQSSSKRNGWAKRCDETSSEIHKEMEMVEIIDGNSSDASDSGHSSSSSSSSSDATSGSSSSDQSDTDVSRSSGSDTE